METWRKSFILYNFVETLWTVTMNSKYIAVCFFIMLQMEITWKRSSVGIIPLGINLILVCYFCLMRSYVYNSLNKKSTFPKDMKNAVIFLGVSLIQFVRRAAEGDSSTLPAILNSSDFYQTVSETDTETHKMDKHEHQRQLVRQL